MTVIKKQAIEHYERMIKWAKKQNQNRKPYFNYMSENIGERWLGEDCSYCQKYKLSAFVLCPPECNLNGKSNHPNKFSCCGGLWEKMDDARTWKTWIKYAEKILEYIKEHG